MEKKAVLLASVLFLSVMPGAFAWQQDASDETPHAWVAQYVGTPVPEKSTTELKPEIEPVKKQYFVGGGGIKHLGSQLIFPLQHPVKFANNCSHPVRHPLVAFGQFSTWVQPYNPGLSACSSLFGMAGSAGIYGLYAKNGGL